MLVVSDFPLADLCFFMTTPTENERMRSLQAVYIFCIEMQENKKINCLFIGTKNLDYKHEKLEIHHVENSREFIE